MQLRTFLADDIKAALAEVRAEMGDGAIIVSTQKAKGGGVMVRAAFDPPEADEIPEPDPASEPPAHFRNALIKRLRRPADEDGARKRFDRAALLSLFARHRLPDSLAHQLAAEAEASTIKDMTLALAAAIDARFHPAPIDFSEARALLLIGLNGAGKTATAAKLGAHAALAGRKAMLIGTDTQGAGAMARLAGFAEHLNVGVVSAATAASLEDRVRDCINADVLAIIDTAGFDPRLKRAAAAIRAIGEIEGIDTIGIVSAMGDSEDASEIAAGLSDAGASRLIVTQLDIAKRRGAVMAAALNHLPCAYFAGSPFVAGSLETPSPLKLARLIVDAEWESPQ